VTKIDKDLFAALIVVKPEPDKYVIAYFASIVDRIILGLDALGSYCNFL
jgi:hypothetical protein